MVEVPLTAVAENVANPQVRPEIDAEVGVKSVSVFLHEITVASPNRRAIKIDKYVVLIFIIQ
ncbi:hypothetical protein GCM10028809_67260 [Spirosoma gilvum]